MTEIRLSKLKDLYVTHGCINFSKKKRRVESIIICFKFKGLLIPIVVERSLILKLNKEILRQFKDDSKALKGLKKK